MEDAIADREGAIVIIDMQCAGAADADLAHLAGHERRMGTDAAARGEDAFRREHAADVFRRGFLADQEHLALERFGFGLVRVEVNAARGRAGTGGQDPEAIFSACLIALRSKIGVRSWLS